MSDARLPSLRQRARTYRPAEPAQRRTVVVSGLMSDAHTWNLVFLQLLVEEFGFNVVNLGSCVPVELLVSSCREQRPRMVVLSSANGHGYRDGLRAIAGLRACPELADTVVVIGGKLGVSDTHRAEHSAELLAAGYDAVYDDDVDDSARFISLASSLAAVGP